MVLSTWLKNEEEMMDLKEKPLAAPACDLAGCGSLEASECGSCGTVNLPFFERLLEGHPWLARLLSARLRLLAGLALFLVALLIPGGGSSSLILFIAAYLTVGTGVLIQALAGLFRGKFFSEYFLMSVATVGALLIGEYAEAFAVMFLFLIGEALEHRAVDRTRRSIDSLNAIRPLIAHVVREEGKLDLSPALIRPGERILVYPGERVPLDGRLEGEGGSVDYSALTGESRPVHLAAGEEVMAGAINGASPLTLTVVRQESDSAVMQIMRLAEAAGRKKTPVEMFMERFSRVYTPAVVFLALALAVFPPLLLAGQTSSVWIYRALNFLVIACPCSLIISVPLAFIAGIGKASRQGIYIRGSQYLEALTNLETVIFDKTGTLTSGNFEVIDLETAPGVSGHHLIRVAAAAEQYSTHPLAEAVKRFHELNEEGEVSYPPLTDLEEIAGQGISARLEGRSLLAGNGKLMKDHGIGVPDRLEDRGDASLIHVAEEGRWIGSLLVSDALREGASRAVDRLRSQGTSTIGILSGDHQAAVSGIGRTIGADLSLAGLLPGDKIDELEKLRGLTAGRTAFVGDGINDAPVLRLADVGIAIGGLGSHAAIEAADVVIMTDELERIPDAVAIARGTKRRVRENVTLILLAKGVLLLLGALGITPLWGAVFADTGLMLLTVLNSLRAYYGGIRP